MTRVGDLCDLLEEASEASVDVKVTLKDGSSFIAFPEYLVFDDEDDFVPEGEFQCIFHSADLKYLAVMVRAMESIERVT
jgi:hypothetical protein